VLYDQWLETSPMTMMMTRTTEQPFPSRASQTLEHEGGTVARVSKAQHHRVILIMLARARRAAVAPHRANRCGLKQNQARIATNVKWITRTTSMITVHPPIAVS